MEDKEIEVDKPEIQEGKIKFLGKAGFFNSPPTKLKIIVRAVQGTCVGIITLVGGSDLFSGGQAKKIVFLLGVLSIIAESILKATGVEQTK